MPITQTQDHDTPRVGFVTNADTVIADKYAEVVQNINGAEVVRIVQPGQPVLPDMVEDYINQYGTDEQKESLRKYDHPEDSQYAEPQNVVEAPASKRTGKAKPAADSGTGVNE
jgi:hypothetical protein